MREQHHQDEGLRARLVQLRRMKRHVERRADVGGGERIGERDRPRHAGRLAVAAAGEETPEASDDVAERDARREHVARRPERQADPADVPERDDDGDDQPAVEHAARPQRAFSSSAGLLVNVWKSVTSSSSFAPTSALMMM